MMEIFPILYINHTTGEVGMFSLCYPTEAEALEKIEGLSEEQPEIDYHTHAIKLKLNVQ